MSLDVVKLLHKIQKRIKKHDSTPTDQIIPGAESYKIFNIL